MARRKPSAESVDIGAALGADAGISIQSLTLYIPNVDRHGQELGNQRSWVLKALEQLGKIGGGATALPAAEGVWYKTDDAEPILDNPVLVYTYIKPDMFVAHLSQLRRFPHTLGRQTNQGEVVLEFDGLLYRIRTFD